LDRTAPTETKKSTAKASAQPERFIAARWLSADSRIIIPAKNAPNANETDRVRDPMNSVFSASCCAFFRRTFARNPKRCSFGVTGLRRF
jgi:hypothetical protein